MLKNPEPHSTHRAASPISRSLAAAAKSAQAGRIPTLSTLDDLRTVSRHCRACPLWRPATQTVFGEGSATASVILVGEQPGDREDIAGAPFVGPAGKLLDRALEEAGIDRDTVYVTNAVKHFKFELRGKRRMHKTPAQREMEACRPWLLQEMELLQPKIVVALGATAAHAVLGARTAIGANRGKWMTQGDYRVLVTVHPSFLLRVPDEDRDEAYALFVKELKMVAAEL